MRTSVLIITLFAACGSSTNGTTGDDDDDAPPDAEMPRPGEPGPPGCGLAAAAFCDTFDAPTANGGREGELDPTTWSVVRAAQAGLGGESLTTGQYAVPIGTATLPNCRTGLPAKVLPGQDVLICDTISTLESNTLLIAAAEQNYGQAAARIRRPFDFATRTGKIVFDATLNPTGLLGWVSLSITEDPIGAPSYLKVQNEENGAVPRNALEIHFNQNCQVEDEVSVSYIISVHDYIQTRVEVADRHCVKMKPGQLNHVEVDVSTQHVVISASPVSEDGVTFAPVEKLAESDLSLAFTSGYVQLGVYNHASVKYSTNHDVDSYIARFDNVGFDGPVLPVEVAAEIPDAMTAAPVPAGTPFTGAANIGYKLGNLAMNGYSAPLSFTSIDLAGATSAKITLLWWSLVPSMNGGQGKVEDYQLDYRINGGAPHAYRYTAKQLAFIAHQLALTDDHGDPHPEPVAGALGAMLDVDVAELHTGTNTIEFATTNVPTSYPPVVYSIDLLVAR